MSISLNFDACYSTGSAEWQGLAARDTCTPTDYSKSSKFFWIAVKQIHKGLLIFRLGRGTELTN